MTVKFKQPEYFSDYSNYCLSYFYEQYRETPNSMGKTDSFNAEKVMKELHETFELKKIATQSSYNTVIKKIYITCEYYETADLILYVGYTVRRKKLIVTQFSFYFKKDLYDTIKGFLEKIIKNYKIKEHKESNINIIIQEGQNMGLREFKIKKPKFNIFDNYNDDLLDLHPQLLARLNKKDDQGIILLHSKPGMGKTSYIKFLMTKLKKTVIYMPPDMSHMISSPTFINFLMNYKNSILIIEDGENVLKTRTGGDNQSISNLLNLSSGLLADVLAIQVIATFNCEIQEIDSALLRKGRLIAKYEFLPLKVDKAQKLSNKLGKNTIIKEDTALCELYNQDEISYSNDKRKVVGFRIPTHEEDEDEIQNPLPRDTPPQPTYSEDED